MNTISLRRANIEDLLLLQHWDEQPYVISSNPNDQWEWEQELQLDEDWQEILIGEIDGRPIGVLQIIDPALQETHYWGKIEENCRAIDIWIGEADKLSKGYGTEMMNLAIERCFTNPNVHTIWIDPLESNKDAIRFYERSGFKFVEKRRFGEDDCLVYQFKRQNWKLYGCEKL